MAVPLAAAPAPLEAPFTNPALLEAELPVLASETATYLEGPTAIDTSLSYPDVSGFAWFIATPIPDPIEVVLPERIRSSFEVTLGRTLVGTPQADVSAGETVPRTGAISLGSLVSYPTMIRPATPIALLRAIEDAGGLPAYEQPLSYETRLAVLSRLFPPSTYVTTLEAIGTETATAQEIVQYLFDQWAAIFPEFRAKPVPPLVLFAPDEAGEYTRTLSTDRIFLRQPEDQERSIQTLLEQLRAVFVGYGVSVDSEDEIVIIPPPWAAGIDRTVVAPRAYRAGPGYAVSLEELGAVGRENVTTSPWELETTYAGEELELRIGVRALISLSPSGPPEPVWVPGYGWLGERIEATLVLEPNVPTLFEHSIVRDGTTGTPVLAVVSYRFTWDRPGATGGTVLVEPVSAPTVAGTGVFAGSIEINVFLTHALLLTAYSLGSMGVRSRTLAGAEVRVPVPAAAFDGSRVINRQTARYADVDFVEDTALLPNLSTRVGATTHTPSGTNYVPNASVQPFLDDDEEPLIIGDRISIAFDYELRRARNPDGLDEEDRDGFYRSETFDLRPGESRTFSYNLNGEVPLTSGFLVSIRFRYTTTDGVPGIRVDFPRWAYWSTNILLDRRYFGHVVAWTTTGSVYQETGEELEVTYDETSGEEDVLTSQLLFGTREGPAIEVQFFRVTYEDLLDITSSIVRYNLAPRARYVGLELTEESEITPDDLGMQLLLPWGESAVLETFSYNDAREYSAVVARRRLDLVVLYPLVGAGGAPASDLEGGVEETASIDGASYLLDAD